MSLAEPGGMEGKKGGSKGKSYKNHKDKVFLPDPIVAIDFEQKPAKTRLNEFLPKKLGRSVTKADMTYSSVEQERGKYQAMVTLHCLGEQQFAGEVCSSLKEAEQSVARQALDHYADEVALHAGVSKKRQLGLSKKHKPTPAGRGIPLADAAALGYDATALGFDAAALGFEPPVQGLTSAQGLAGLEFAAEPVQQRALVPAAPVPRQPKLPCGVTGEAARRDGPNHKDQFLAFLAWKIGRSASKAEFTFTSTQVASGQYQATVTLHCAGDQQFAGEVCVGAKAAEMNAAQQALAYYAEEVAQYHAIKGPKAGNAGGKSKGKGSAGLRGEVATQLAQLLTQLLGRPAYNTDFSYQNMELGPGQFQSAVTLHCLQEQQFAGEVEGSMQAAQASAAQQVIAFYGSEMGMPVGMGGGSIERAEGPSKKKKKKNNSGSAGHLAHPDSTSGLWQAKEQLSQFCIKLTQHQGSWRKGQIEYAVNEVGSGFQAIVKLNCLGGAEYAGEVGITAKEAEKSAALYAYAALGGEQAEMPAEMPFAPMVAASPASFMVPMM